MKAKIFSLEYKNLNEIRRRWPQYHFTVLLSWWKQKDLQPAGATVDKLAAVVLAPPLGEADPHCVRVERTVLQGGIPQPGVQARHLPAEYLQGVAGGDLENTEGPGVGNVQGGGVDKDRNLRPVVGPDTSIISTQYHTCKENKLKYM